MTAPQDPFARPGDVPPGGSQPPVGSQPYGAPQYGSQPFGSPPYGSAPGPGAPYGPARNGLGTASLVLGVLALLTSITVVGGLLFGLLAVVFGIIGRGRARRGEATNGGVATAGIVLGALGLVGSIALIALGASLLNSDSGKAYQDCLRDAGSDRAAVEQCATEFSEQVTS